ncbi:carboxymuconolactone decarboxylase family protein [Ilumatobacter coccineus]|jgi:hypothetical protein|uniref:Uncharacterized protein n=1 Tax=Ilumatobacter coccineus (strain NBRC 103263 / KCTC 29153 / YM16-304) TaxID=1313172 RepID=A0A6C7EFE4_ILUCY|nr:hypothetical protein [Ilumatobacter coccineus]BAN03745.1 hypothetical protein YM304_34310 [Ilumatobacter coccineus YM16-304]
MLTNTPLLEQADELRRDAAGRTPGRLAELIDTRVAQLVGTAAAGVRLPDDVSPAEQCVIDIVEQFLVDVHGITDRQFARLSDHYAHDEQVAIMFHLALADGFAKLDLVQRADETTT